jgi:hypothetical protein
MTDPYRLPAFRNRTEAKRTIRVFGPDRVTREAPEVRNSTWGPVSFHVEGGETYFEVAVPVAQGEGIRDIPVTFIGGFDPDGKTDSGVVRYAFSKSRSFRAGMVPGLKTWAVEALLPDMIAGWLQLDHDVRLRLVREDAVRSADYQAAYLWLQEKDLAGQPPSFFDLHRERLLAAHCRAIAYTLDGDAGRSARRLVADGWRSSAEDLIATARAVAL